ncbi:MAG: hypothetical protein ABIP89_14405 [Polyangiaceae bacterium]
MPTRSTNLLTIALGGCVAFYASAANAQSAEPPTAPPQVMIVVEQPAPAVIVAAPPARIETSAAARGKDEEEWYGYQTLIVDAASLGLMIGGAAMASHSSGNTGGYVALAGAAGYVLGAPIVHWTHGRIGPGFGSLGLRVGLPLSGLFWGAVIGAASGSRHDDAVGAGAAIGFVGGMAGAILLDAALLGFEKPSEKEKEAYETAQAKHPIRWVPTLAPQKEGATIGVSGLFF